jgi:hypothetical protein
MWSSVTVNQVNLFYSILLHRYCRDCFERSFKEQTIYPCSTCQTPLIKTDIINIPMEDIFEDEIDDGIPYESSSKIEALVDDLKRVRSTSMDSIKSIVFSQWTTALNIIGVKSFHFFYHIY